MQENYFKTMLSPTASQVFPLPGEIILNFTTCLANLLPIVDTLMRKSPKFSENFIIACVVLQGEKTFKKEIQKYENTFRKFVKNFPNFS